MSAEQQTGQLGESPIFVAGHRGLVGSAIVRRLRAAGANRLLLPARERLDLRRQDQVESFFATQRPQLVFLAAARVGGIEANRSHPAQFLADNLQIQTNVIDAAWRHGVRKLLFLGSSCIYPRDAPQPMREEYLLTGALEPTNEWYAIAKIAGLKMCQAYRRQYGFDAVSAMPTNLYGPGDNFSLTDAHVLPALMRKCDEARERAADSVQVWGTGRPRREFLHVDDLADACLFLMQHYSEAAPINVGWGQDVSITDLAQQVAHTVGFSGRLEFDPSRPDGTPRKLLDVSRLTALGWRPRLALREGLAATYAWYREHRHELRT
ncbi:MAG TPA: GDP-L-fucose synthase [Steroidobacteraceae bacterium]|nr:GDP-L-fucose synthase [Steroidobacteraceae bacterium]